MPQQAQAFSLFDSVESLLGGSGVANAEGLGALHTVDTPALKAATNINPNPSTGGSIAIVDGVALIPEEGPSGTLADIEESPASGKVSIYVVRPGDTLGAIGKMFGVTTNTIIWANDLDSRGTIRPGQTLVILPVTGIEHTIVKGETLASLAKKYGADANEIAQYNGLTPGGALAVGTDIIIPNGEPAPAPSTSSSGSKGIREPLLGGGGPTIAGFFAPPLVGGIITQGLHGWNGVDIGASRGTPIFASAAGVVIVARSSGYNGGYGSYVVIQHNNGTQTLYAHASKILVSADQLVGQGQTIALVGTTGKSTGSHLHFEVRGAANPYSSVRVGTHE